MSRSVQHIQSRSEAQHRLTHDEIQEIAKQVDDRLKHLSERVIPSQPYILSVPSDYPYRYRDQFHNTWFVGTPFSRHEEELQYMSFLPHQNEGEDLLKVVGGWADANGNPIEDEASPSQPPMSGSSTPVPSSGRKKISLKDYKTKDKTKEANTPHIKIESPKLAMKSDGGGGGGGAGDDNRKAANRVGKIKVAGAGEERVSDSHARVSTKYEDKKQADIITRKRNATSPPAQKRRRLSLDGSASEDEHLMSRSEAMKSAKEKKPLPLLLSPTLPASEKVNEQKGLPELLSPLLPPSLKKALARIESKNNSENQPAKRTDQVKTILGNALGSTSEKKSVEKSTIEVNRGKIDSQLSASANNPAPRAVSPHFKPLIKSNSRPTTPVQADVRQSPRPRPSLEIVLKYGKKNKTRVERLLKFASRPRRKQPILEEHAMKDVPQISHRNVTDSPRVGGKRILDASPERPAKKTKSGLLDTPDKSKGVGGTGLKSPVHLAVKSTPRKELKSSAMARVASSDAIDIKTPPDRGRTSTPVGASSTGQPKETPTPSSHAAATGRDVDRAAWQELNQKFFALGRTLKREGTALVNEGNQAVQSRAVVLLAEALLCFMINLAAQSHSRPNIDPGWASIFPFHIFVFRVSRKFRHVHGLIIQLGAICRQFYHNHNMDRLSRDPLPDDTYGSAPTPGSDGITKSGGDDNEKYKKRYLQFRDDLVQNSRELQAAWLEGSRYLSPYLIEKEYPKTWAKRMKDTSSRGSEKLQPQNIGKEFFLPLDANSTAFEAMRFALALLEEWSNKEGLDWKPRIDI